MSCYTPAHPLRPKRQFRSPAAARKFLRQVDSKLRTARHIYFCDDCGAYHLSRRH